MNFNFWSKKTLPTYDQLALDRQRALLEELMEKKRQDIMAAMANHQIDNSARARRLDALYLSWHDHDLATHRLALRSSYGQWVAESAVDHAVIHEHKGFKSHVDLASKMICEAMADLTKKTQTPLRIPTTCVCVGSDGDVKESPEASAMTEATKHFVQHARTINAGGDFVAHCAMMANDNLDWWNTGTATSTVGTMAVYDTERVEKLEARIEALNKKVDGLAAILGQTLNVEA